VDNQRKVTNRPLAGTRRRGATPEEDKALERELLADEKECAEHVMLVDLGRNDVGKVMHIHRYNERYAHVSSQIIFRHPSLHASFLLTLFRFLCPVALKSKL